MAVATHTLTSLNRLSHINKIHITFGEELQGFPYKYIKQLLNTAQREYNKPHAGVFIVKFPNDPTPVEDLVATYNTSNTPLNIYFDDHHDIDPYDEPYTFDVTESPKIMKFIGPIVNAIKKRDINSTKQVFFNFALGGDFEWFLRDINTYQNLLERM